MNKEQLEEFTKHLQSDWRPQPRHPSRFSARILQEIEARKRNKRRAILTVVSIILLAVPFSVVQMQPPLIDEPLSSSELASMDEEDYGWWDINQEEPPITEGLSEDYVVLASLFLEDEQPFTEEAIP